MFRSTFLALFLLVVAAVTSSVASATSICQNNVCGRIVCQFGCVQRAVNGVCVENRCTGGFGNVSTDSNTTEDTATAPAPWEETSPTDARCVSCAGGCCAHGNSFLQAERACKARCGAFGCFTRC